MELKSKLRVDKPMPLVSIIIPVYFYRIDNGKIYFGEMTFTPLSGMFEWDPSEYNLKLGEMLKIGKNG